MRNWSRLETKPHRLLQRCSARPGRRRRSAGPRRRRPRTRWSARSASSSATPPAPAARTATARRRASARRGRRRRRAAWPTAGPAAGAAAARPAGGGRSSPARPTSGCRRCRRGRGTSPAGAATRHGRQASAPRDRSGGPTRARLRPWPTSRTAPARRSPSRRGPCWPGTPPPHAPSGPPSSPPGASRTAATTTSPTWPPSSGSSARCRAPTDPDAVRLAAWYHDVAYDPERADNEQVSAARARAGLRGLVPDARVDEVERLVLLTAGHDPAPDDANGAVLCDADLAVLAGPAGGLRRLRLGGARGVRPPVRRGVHRRADRRPRAPAGPAGPLPDAGRRPAVGRAGRGQPDRGADPAQARAASAPATPPPAAG